MNEFVTIYIEYIKKNNLSSNTIDAYSRDITRFSEYINSTNQAFESIDSLTIMNYVQGLLQGGKKKSSIARNIICIRSFYKFLISHGYIDKAPIIDYNIPKYERSIPEVLTPDEVDILLSAPDTNTDKGVRDKAMLELMYASGIKVTELLDLSIEDIDLNFEYLRCKGSKGMERIIPIGRYSVEWVKKYINVREKNNLYKLDYLFLNSRGERMTRQGFWKIIKFYGKKSGIKKDINLYTLRHSIAVHLIENGADVRSLKELLGYKDISAIQVYMDIIKKNKLMEVYKKSHPRA